MGFLDSLNTSSSALTANRVRMDTITQNVANANTTRTANGGPYRRQIVTLEEIPSNFKNTLQSKISGNNGSSTGGVRVSSIASDQTPFKLVYDPDHPDANADGYVEMPNVDTTKEMIDFMSATRSYEANVTMINAIKSMAMKALEIGTR